VGDTLDAVEGLWLESLENNCEIFLWAAHYADQCNGDGLAPAGSGRVLAGTERSVRLGGVGTPRVGEFAASAFGARLRMGTLGGKAMIADALDARHRLPRCWARVQEFEARVPWVRYVARRTRELSVEAAAVIDAELAEQVDGRVAWSRFCARFEGLLVAADPDAAAARERARREEVFARSTRGSEHGIKGFYLRGPASVVIRLEATVAFVAEALKALGGGGADEDQRRVTAMAILANPMQAVELLAAYAAHRARTGEPADDHDEPVPDDELPFDHAHDHEDDDHDDADTDETAAAGEGDKGAGAAGETHEPEADERDEADEDAADPDETDATADAAGTSNDEATDGDAADESDADTDKDVDANADDGDDAADAAGVGRSARAVPDDRDDAPGAAAAADATGDTGADGAPAADGGDGAGAAGGDLVPRPFRPDELPGWLARACDPESRWRLHWPTLLPRVHLFVHIAKETLDADSTAHAHADVGPDSDSATRAGPPGSGVARWEGEGPITREYVREQLAPFHAFTITGVIDLAGQEPVDAYEIPRRHRQAVRLRTPADCFPYAGNLDPVDVDHTRAYQHTPEPGQQQPPPGQSRMDNYSPLGRFHHRVKTHGDWQLRQPFDGIYIWRDPYGAHYLVDHTGTRRTSPPRRRPTRSRPGTRPRPTLIHIHHTDTVIELDFDAA
jgi:hypothetical protein